MVHGGSLRSGFSMRWTHWPIWRTEVDLTCGIPWGGASWVAGRHFAKPHSTAKVAGCSSHPLIGQSMCSDSIPSHTIHIWCLNCLFASRLGAEKESRFEIETFGHGPAITAKFVRKAKIFLPIEGHKVDFMERAPSFDISFTYWVMRAW